MKCRFGMVLPPWKRRSCAGVGFMPGAMASGMGRPARWRKIFSADDPRRKDTFKGRCGVVLLNCIVLFMRHLEEFGLDGSPVPVDCAQICGVRDCALASALGGESTVSALQRLVIRRTEPTTTSVAPGGAEKPTNTSQRTRARRLK